MRARYLAQGSLCRIVGYLGELPCVLKAAAGGMCFRDHSNRAILIEIAAPNGFRLHGVAALRVYPAFPLA